MESLKITEYFGVNSNRYAHCRPRYPAELFAWLASISPQNELVWDCATGSGQAAISLADHFTTVIASDINSNQIRKAIPHPRIDYRCFPSEETPLESGSIDLVTVACGVHWLQQKKFYNEVRRVCRPESIIAVWTYEWPWTGQKNLDEILSTIKDEAFNGYWPDKAHYYFDHYTTIDFPFLEIEVPDFSISCNWSPDDLLNFISTWSVAIKYIKQQGNNIIDSFREKFALEWNRHKVSENFKLPLYFRVGKIGHQQYY